MVSKTTDKRQNSGSERVIVIEGWLRPEDAAYNASSLNYLPFDVPEGVTSIHVRRETEPWEKRTVALLVFDARGHSHGLEGFRGYQGAVNEDTEFTITGHPETTTPWYMPGKLAGRWHLGLWYLRPATKDVHYRFTVTLGTDEPAPDKEYTCPEWTQAIPGTGPGWYAGSLHNHTAYSYDAHIGGEPRTASRLAAEHHTAGIDFMAITDHNHPRSHFDLAAVAAEFPDMLLLAGNEVTTINGHANIIGAQPGARFEFRGDPGDGQMRAVREKARSQGALFIVNHPFGPCSDCPWRFTDEIWAEADAIEVWNREWADGNRRAVDAWDALLKEGRRMPATGGTDYHRGPNSFTPVTWVYAESLSREAILEAIRQGRTFVTEGPLGPRAFISGSDKTALPGDTLAPKGGKVTVNLRVIGGLGLTVRFVWDGGERRLPVDGADVHLCIDVPAEGTTYVRAEIEREDGRVAALTGAIYVGA